MDYADHNIRKETYTYRELARMEGMSNYEILNLASQIGLKLNGVMMRDEIETLKPGCYVFNIQASYQGNGTHWVGFYVSKNKEYVYCDSYGVPPFQDLIDKLSGQTILYNKIQFQNFTSDECGLFALLFLYCLEGTTGNKMLNSFENFIEYFILHKDELHKNDKIILRIFKELVE